jgi:hypothetical protein
MYCQLFIFSRFRFTREEMQAFRDEHEQRNGQLSRPDDEHANVNTRLSSLKRSIDTRCSVQMNTITTSSSNSAYDHRTPIDILRQTTIPSSDSFDYR